MARLLLALFFLLSSAQTIDGPIEHPRVMLPLTAGFILYAFLLLGLTWRNWWLDHKLAFPAHLLDLTLFFALDLAAGMPVNSPFFVFFVYLVLSAAARWGWVAGMRTAAVATVLFIGEHVLEGALESEDTGGFLFGFMRGAHLAVLGLMMSWFGMTHLSGRGRRNWTFGEIGPGEDPVQRALTYMTNCLGGRWAAMVWTEPEEPWLNIAIWAKHQEFRTERAGPEEYAWLVAPELDGQTFLFDVAGRRALVNHQRRRTPAELAPINPELAKRVPLTTGIATPIESGPCTGYLFIGGMDGLAWDDMPNARRCAQDLARGLERWETVRVTAETSDSEARLRVARNLHDSLAQIMAGIGLKLRAARTTAPEGVERDRELKAIEDELVVYQQQISGFIADLRQPRPSGGSVDLATELNGIAAAIRRQWSIEVEVHGSHDATIPKLLGDEVTHLLREAAANAVRHGKATKLVLSGEIADDCLRLVIRDNGSGFPEAGSFDHFSLARTGAGPRSIIERVGSFRGNVDLVSSAGGAIVSILLPLGRIDA